MADASFPRSRSRRGAKAQAMVEFALVAPIFFLLLFGIIEVGRFIFYYETLNSATREGARYAIVNGASTIGCPSGPPARGSTPCDVPGANVEARVRESALGVAGTLTVTSKWGVAPLYNGNNGRGETVTVKAESTYKTLVPLLPLPNITVTAESSLVINN